MTVTVLQAVDLSEKIQQNKSFLKDLDLNFKGSHAIVLSSQAHPVDFSDNFFDFDKFQGGIQLDYALKLPLVLDMPKNCPSFSLVAANLQDVRLTIRDLNKANLLNAKNLSSLRVMGKYDLAMIEAKLKDWKLVKIEDVSFKNKTYLWDGKKLTEKVPSKTLSLAGLQKMTPEQLSNLSLFDVQNIPNVYRTELNDAQLTEILIREVAQHKIRLDYYGGKILDSKKTQIQFKEKILINNAEQRNDLQLNPDMG